MIDFRYHVVTIVALFLAFALGLAVGSFTLVGPLGSTLAGQVDQLRTDKQQLRSQLKSANLGSSRQEKYLASIFQNASKGQLDGKTIMIVTLPNTKSSFIKATETALQDSGGSIIGRVELTSNLFSPAESVRSVLQNSLQSQGLAVDNIPQERLFGGMLVRTLTAQGADDTHPTKVLQPLQEAGILQYRWGDRPADVVVVLFTPSTEIQGTNSLESWRNMLSGMASSPGPVVVDSGSKTTSDSAGEDSLLSSLRTVPVAVTSISTIDNGDSAVGVASLPIVVREEISGHAGHYGLRSDATQLAPQIGNLG